MRPRPPRAESPATYSVAAGEVVRPREDSGDWVRVDHGRDSGWIERAALGWID